MVTTPHGLCVPVTAASRPTEFSAEAAGIVSAARPASGEIVHRNVMSVVASQDFFRNKPEAQSVGTPEVDTAPSLRSPVAQALACRSLDVAWQTAHRLKSAPLMTSLRPSVG